MKILFITTKIGFGHVQVANAVLQELKKLNPSIEAKIVTYFDFFPPFLEKLIVWGYVRILSLSPKGLAYIYLAEKKYEGKGIVFWSKFLGRRYAKMINNFTPSLIIITQGLACQWIGHLRQKGLIKTPAVAILTDFVVHPFWISPEIDRYYVPTESIRKEMVKRGINATKIAVTGIPIREEFEIDVDSEKICREIGIDPNNPTILIMGGGWGLGRLDLLLKMLDKELPPEIQIIVVTGSNRELYRKMKNVKYTHVVKIFGRRSDMPKLMKCSKLVITKPGGVTLAEVLAKKLPSILWDPIPGQEEENAEYITSLGAGVRIKEIEEIAPTVLKLLYSKELKEMAQIAELIGKPFATKEVVNDIYNLFLK